MKTPPTQLTAMESFTRQHPSVGTSKFRESKKMNVLHVIPSVSPRAGGPSQAILPMCLALREQGVNVLVAVTDDGLSGKNGPVHLQYGDISDYKGQPTIFFPSQIGASFKYSRPFAEWLVNNVANYDLVHIHAVFNHACLAAAHACRKRRVPYIVRPLGTLDPWGMKQKSWRKSLFWPLIGKRMLRHAAAVHYTSRQEQQATEESLGLNHGTVIPLGVASKVGGPTSAGAEFVERFPSLQQRPFVLVLSRLIPTKGLHVLLSAFLALIKQKQFNSWQLVLAGEGPPDYLSELRQKVASEGAEESVLFPGWLDGEMKEAILRRASLLALPSYHENFGLCVMEALACGVPVLVSPNVNLAPEIEAVSAGWISEIDHESMTRKLAEIFGSAEERSLRGAAGRNLAAKFSWDKIADQLIAVYTSLLPASDSNASPV
ncbi:MAG TPA: glycosyltransferase [Pyrinomonadaceae bacterium]|nr:glycosyltransferase [Pyrinomonadaceae bacterium]